MKSAQTIISMLEHELGKARAQVKSASSTCAMFGHYDDCGPEYNEDLIEAKAICAYLEDLVVRVKAK